MQCVDLGGRRIIKKSDADAGFSQTASLVRLLGHTDSVVLTAEDFFQAEDGIRDVERSRGLGDVYKRQVWLKLAQ